MNKSQTYKHVREIAESHYENFPVGSFLLPAEIRDYVYAIYAFARQADDYADEISHKPTALNKLNEWRSFLKKTEQGNPPDHPIFIALADTIENGKIDTGLLYDLLNAFERDIVNPLYKTWEELLEYCKLSANPIGRLLLGLFGIESEKAKQYSDSLCTGLQLINFWQDLSMDIPQKRYYIPESVLSDFSLEGESLHKPIAPITRQQIIQKLTNETKKIYESGKLLFPFLRGRIKIEIKLTYYGGEEILRKTEDYGAEIFNKRPQLRKQDWLKIFVRSIF